MEVLATVVLGGSLAQGCAGTMTVSLAVQVLLARQEATCHASTWLVSSGNSTLARQRTWREGEAPARGSAQPATQVVLLLTVSHDPLRPHPSTSARVAPSCSGDRHTATRAQAPPHHKSVCTLPHSPPSAHTAPRPPQPHTAQLYPVGPDEWHGRLAPPAGVRPPPASAAAAAGGSVGTRKRSGAGNGLLY